MSVHTCPFCNSKLTSSEARSGHCPLCDRSIDIAIETEPQHGNLNAEPAWASPAHQPRLSAGMTALVVSLTALLAASFVTPIGAVPSLILSWRKGGSICAKGFCSQPATTQVAYSGGHRMGYCSDHAKHAPRSVSRKSFGMPFFYALGLLWFVCAFIGTARDVFRNPQDDEKRRTFVKWWLIGFFGVNAGFWVICRWLLAGS